MVQGKNPKKTAGYTIDVEVLNKFEDYCIEKAHNRSAVVENLIKNWLLANAEWTKK